MSNREKFKDEKIIIGIDPGTLVTGYGIISVINGSSTPLDYGCICPPVKMKLSERYLIIFNALETLLERYRPDALAVESQFFGCNAQSALKLGQARGIVMVVAKRLGIAIYEYTPTSVKKAVGRGNASKTQVQELVKLLLGLQVLPEPFDAADALAVALCHSNAVRYSQFFDKEI
ncbi:MAG: crossover junction endodeoxyribonuclease RuvC [Parachlamydiaceae bacterium]|nr:crossover junction endodeoxyribonuclease RuvC [Parachlamydiaceae bacterium]